MDTVDTVEMDNVEMDNVEIGNRKCGDGECCEIEKAVLCDTLDMHLEDGHTLADTHW